MKIFNFILFFLITGFYQFVYGQSAAVEHGQLTVIIDGIENDQGKVLVALCNSEKDFESSGNAFRMATLDINDKKASVTFDDLQAAEYALKVFHDENENGELDTNFLGIPSELRFLQQRTRQFRAGQLGRCKIFFKITGRYRQHSRGMKRQIR